jgi:hypothetical protein
MFTNTKLALAAALILGTASAALANDRHHGPVLQSQVRAGANDASASANRISGLSQPPTFGHSNTLQMYPGN